MTTKPPHLDALMRSARKLDLLDTSRTVGPSTLAVLWRPDLDGVQQWQFVWYSEATTGPLGCDVEVA